MIGKIFEVFESFTSESGCDYDMGDKFVIIKEGEDDNYKIKFIKCIDTCIGLINNLDKYEIEEYCGEII